MTEDCCLLTQRKRYIFDPEEGLYIVFARLSTVGQTYDSILAHQMTRHPQQGDQAVEPRILVLSLYWSRTLSTSRKQ